MSYVDACFAHVEIPDYTTICLIKKLVPSHSQLVLRELTPIDLKLSYSYSAWQRFFLLAITPICSSPTKISATFLVRI